MFKKSRNYKWNDPVHEYIKLRDNIKWYICITYIAKPNSIGFLLNDYYYYIPNLQLSVCYYKLGNIEKSIFYNEEAAKYKPDSSEVLYNRNFFNSLNNT